MSKLKKKQLCVDFYRGAEDRRQEEYHCILREISYNFLELKSFLQYYRPTVFDQKATMDTSL